jgi:hypothetical protein
MRPPPRLCLLYAIFLIAAYAIPVWSGAQNVSQSSDAPSAPVEPAKPTQVEDAERLERDRILQERAKSGTAYEATKVQCYQRFRVNDCLHAARDQHHAQLADLKRQENSLNETPWGAASPAH